jgi:hypothetical protein
MITIHFDFIDGTEVSYEEGLKLKDNFNTCCLDFFTTENLSEDIVVVKKDGSFISRNELLENVGGYTYKEIRKEHNIQNMLKANAFFWKAKLTK